MYLHEAGKHSIAVSLFSLWWNLSAKATLGAQNSAFVERLAAFGGYFLLWLSFSLYNDGCC